MKTLAGVLIFFLFLPYSTCKADMMTLSANSKTHFQTSILKKQNSKSVPDPGFVEISYGFAHVRFLNGPVQAFKIDHSSEVKAGVPLSLISTAEAAVVPDVFKVEDFEKICNAIPDAGRLDDLKPVLLDKNFELLKAKASDGVSQHVVLAMLQATHPRKIRITDSRIEEQRAEFAVVGQSAWGPVEGLMHMVKVEGIWKIEDESWQVGRSYDQGNRGIVTGFKSLSDADQYLHPGPGEIIPGISSNYLVRQGTLQLNKVANNRRKRAFMFVFLMDKAKVDPDRLAVVKEKPRARVHVLGSKKIFPEQGITENEYPIDISVGKYGDGYAPQEWNLSLPSGKPREVAVSWLWSF